MHGIIRGVIDQQQCPALGHWQQPAILPVHRHPAISGHVFLEQATVLGVQLIEQQPILGSQHLARLIQTNLGSSAACHWD
ncbi:hypothetical protein thsps117_30280 [Pseudomonas sp. No.117]